MLSVMTIEFKEYQLEKAIEENNQALCDLLHCLGETGKERISLFIEKAGGDGKMGPSRL